MAKVEFTAEMVEMSKKANDRVKGTSRYGAYYVPFEAKTKGKWHFLGWHCADRVGIIKNIKGKRYVYYTDGFGNEFRCELTDIYIKMLGLEVA